jgi:predicted nucleic acid-binding protein
MSDIFWDTNLFIYLLERQDQLWQRTIDVHRRMLERGDRLHTSALTLAEVLVRPVQQGDVALQSRFEELLRSTAVVHDFGPAAARRYAAIRAAGSIRPPDAIQLACAAEAGVDLFITNDDRLSRRNVPGIAFITSLERAFL